jgi:phosphoketolase
MFNQHAKWLKVSKGIPWRKPIASLNYLLASHVWRQDHNGFSHQDPDFITRIGKFLDESGAPAPSLLVIVSCMADRSCGSIA